LAESIKVATERNLQEKLSPNKHNLIKKSSLNLKEGEEYPEDM